MTTARELVAIAHRSGPRRWENWHRTCDQQVADLVDVWNPIPDESDVAGYNATTRMIQDLIADALKSGREIRALGGGWSWSPIGLTDGILVNTQPLNYKFQIGPHHLDRRYKGDASELLFVQSGASIAELNAYLEARGRCLRTSGASNGQTLGGAMSTGTHGSAIDIGSMADFVVALHLVPSTDLHLWLEPESRPVLNDMVPKMLGAAVVRDDQLFNAALVSFGSFGIIHGALIETDPLYYLEVCRDQVPLDEYLWWAIERLDFSNLGRLACERPYHFQVVFNPYSASSVSRTAMFRHEEKPAHFPRVTPAAASGAADGATEIVGRFFDLFPLLMPVVSGPLLQTLLATDPNHVCGTRGEIFRDTTTRGRTASTALGIPLGSVRKSVEIALDVCKRELAPVVVAVRYAKASGATLGFTLHRERTCVLEVDGLANSRTLTAYSKLWRKLRDARVPFTFHWGKVNDLDTKTAYVREMYGQRFDSWCAARRTVLPTEGLRRAFSNEFLRRSGLSA